MARRALPALLVAAAALADAAAEPAFALYALLLAVPALALAGLAALGDVLEGEASPARQLQALLSAAALALVVAGAMVRAPAIRDGELPALAGSALVACLVLLAVEAVVGAARAAVERPPRRRRVTAQAEELREAA
jgi:Ca2+/H+ antiporter